MFRTSYTYFVQSTNNKKNSYSCDGPSSKYLNNFKIQILQAYNVNLLKSIHDIAIKRTD